MTTDASAQDDPRPTAPSPDAGTSVGEGRRSRRRTVAAIAAFATVSFLSGAGGVLAAASFTDVPPGHPFETEIGWATTHGITQGYEDGTFRPNEDVSRQAAVAFLSRYNDALSFQTVEVDPPTAATFEVTVDCPVNTRAVAGGGSTSAINTMMTDSFPVGGATWRVRWETDDNVGIDPDYVRGWALCQPM